MRRSDGQLAKPVWWARSRYSIYRFFVLARPGVRTLAACGPREDKNMATSYRRVVVVDQVHSRADRYDAARGGYLNDATTQHRQCRIRAAFQERVLFVPDVQCRTSGAPMSFPSETLLRPIAPS
jgi:hypothetical protein